MYVYKKPCGQKHTLVFRRRFVKHWGVWGDALALVESKHPQTAADAGDSRTC